MYLRARANNNHRSNVYYHTVRNNQYRDNHYVVRQGGARARRGPTPSELERRWQTDPLVSLALAQSRKVRRGRQLRPGVELWLLG